MPAFLSTIDAHPRQVQLSNPEPTDAAAEVESGSTEGLQMIGGPSSSAITNASDLRSMSYACCRARYRDCPVSALPVNVLFDGRLRFGRDARQMVVNVGGMCCVMTTDTVRIGDSLNHYLQRLRTARRAADCKSARHQWKGRSL
jgi:hypothetical protein